MGLLESAINGPFYHAGATAETYKDNPDQALLGVNTPAEAYVANSLGGNYTPTTNMYGGPSEDVYAKAARDNVDMTANRIADTAAPAVLASTGLGAPFAAALAAGNALGQGYEMQRMQQQMRDRGYQNLPVGSYSGGGGISSAAKQVQSHGRNKDSMLVHMSPREVKGLQQLAMASGGSLTINPHTGLPEAGWLDSLLPMIGGIGLSMIPGVGPLAAAGIMGAGYGVATGSLEKGLMAGLSAYGGARLGGSLAELGGSAIADAGGASGEELLKTSTADALKGQAMDASRGMVEPNIQEITQNALNPQNFPKLTPDQLSTLQSQVPNAANPADILKGAGMSNATTGITPAQSMGEGIKQLGTGSASTASFLDANKYALAGAAAPVILDTFGQKGIGPVATADHSHDGDYLKKISPNFKAQDPVRPNPYYSAQYPSYTYAASGGLMDANPPTPGLMDGAQAANVNFMGKDMYPMSQQDNAHYATPSQMPTSAQQTMASYEQNTNPLTGEVNMAAGGQVPGYATGVYVPSSYSSYNNFQPLSHLPVKGVYTDSDPDTAKKPADQATMIRFNKILAAANLGKAKLPKTNIKGLGDIPDVEAAGGGMMHGIGGYSDGGRMLKGPGDGMSDSIPAVIGSKQPARLADGEFVVPADVVSHLGNGSTEAGAKHLYAMMDKIRRARTGKIKQAPAVKAEKYLPK